MSDYELMPDFVQTNVLEQLLIDYNMTRQLELQMRATAQHIKTSLRPLFDDLITIAEVPTQKSGAARSQTINRGMMLGMSAVHNNLDQRWVLQAWNDRARAMVDTRTAESDAGRYRTLLEIEKYTQPVSVEATKRLLAISWRSRGQATYFGDFRRGMLFCLYGAASIVEQTNISVFTRCMEDADLSQAAWLEIENRVVSD